MNLTPEGSPPVAGETAAAAVLLLGPEAEALAPRLTLSGHRPLLEADLANGPAPAPRAVILAPREAGRILELRKRFPRTPLLLGVTSDSLEGRVRCLASGADDFWLTAVGPSDLLTRLRLHLGLGQGPPLPAAEPASRPLQAADLVVNPSTREVRRGLRSLSLTAREYDLLLLLLRAGGAVLSRDAILAEIWREERGASSNVIEVYVRYLRQKLEENGERRLIHTVRGQGYCLAERLPPRPASKP
jgi:two-component system response regulator MprA